MPEPHARQRTQPGRVSGGQGGEDTGKVIRIDEPGQQHAGDVIRVVTQERANATADVVDPPLHVHGAVHANLVSHGGPCRGGTAIQQHQDRVSGRAFAAEHVSPRVDGERLAVRTLDDPIGFGAIEVSTRQQRQRAVLAANGELRDMMADQV